MQVIKNTNIRIKVLLPAALLVAIPSLLIMWFGLYNLNKSNNTAIDLRIQQKEQEIENDITAKAEEAYHLALFTASHPTVLDAYMKYHNQEMDFKQTADWIDHNFDSSQILTTAYSDAQIRIHLHVPPGRSLYRSWTFKRGDNLQDKRESIRIVNEWNEAIKGIEVGRSGLAIRGVAPIFSPVDKTFMGSTEAEIPLNRLIKSVKRSADEDFAIFIHTSEFAGTDVGLLSHPSNALQIGDFVMVDFSSSDFSSRNMDPYIFKEVFLNTDTTIIYDHQDYRYAVFPITDMHGNVPAIGVYQIHVQGLLYQYSSLLQIMLIIIGISIAAAVLILFYITGIIIRPLTKINNLILRLSRGQIPRKIDIATNDDLMQIVSSMKSLIGRLRHTTDFADEIGKGNYESDFTPLGDFDIMGNALIDMQRSLRKARDVEEERKKEEQINQWASHGRTIINEVIRSRSEDISLLADNITRKIITYLNASQGALYIINDENPQEIFIEMLSVFAYDMKRHYTKKIIFDDGLLSTCIKDKSTIYLDEVPEGYLDITSGLGKSKPASLLIVPLMSDLEVLGVIEIASFSLFEEHQIQFIESISKSIGSALHTTRINQHTSFLIKQLEEKSEQFRLQELKTAQKLDVLIKKQKRLEARENSSLLFENTIGRTLMRADFDLNGTIITGNDLFFNLMQYEEDELIGKNIDILLQEKDKKVIEQLWQDMLRLKMIEEKEIRFETRLGSRWMLTFLNPVTNKNGEVETITLIGLNINKQKSKSIEFEEEVHTINGAILKSEYKPDGTIISDNQRMAKVLGFNTDDNKGKNLFDLLSDEKIVLFRQIWRKVLDGIPTENEEMIRAKDGSEKWFKGLYTAIRDYDGKVQKVIFIAVEITDIKKDALKKGNLHLQLNEQNQLLISENELLLQKNAMLKSEITLIKQTRYQVEEELNNQINQLTQTAQEREARSKDQFNRLVKRLKNYQEKDKEKDKEINEPD